MVGDGAARGTRDPREETDEAGQELLSYPVGRFEPRGALSAEVRSSLLEELTALPGQLRRAVAGLSPGQLDTPYRPGGWTVRQLVHHVADSHMNAYMRFKLAATETDPLIRTYEQEAWAELADAQAEDPETSLLLLEGLHRRWVHFLRSLAPEAFERTLRHPDLGTLTLAWALDHYAWHGRHHVAHVTRLRERMGW